MNATALEFAAVPTENSNLALALALRLALLALAQLALALRLLALAGVVLLQWHSMHCISVVNSEQSTTFSQGFLFLLRGRRQPC